MASNGSSNNGNSRKFDDFLTKLETARKDLKDPILSSIPGEVEKICKELHYVRSTLKNLQQFQVYLAKPIKTLEKNIDDIVEGAQMILKDNQEDSLRNKLRREIQTNIGVLRNNITKLKIKIPLQHQPSISSSEAARDFQKTISSSKFGELPSLCEGRGLKETKVFNEMKRVFDEELNDRNIKDIQERELDQMRKRLCLLCFAVFPEDAEIRRRLLHLWWIGEDLVPEEGNFTDKALYEFVRLGLIEPVKAESRPYGDAKSFKMHPLIRASFIELAKEAKFFDFDSKGNPSSDVFNESTRACLVKKNIEEEDEEKKNLKTKLAKEDIKKLRTLFNVSEQFPDLRIPEKAFSKMKDIGVVYFGRWESTAKRHIEVESVEFLKALKDKKKLRFLSLQGMSRVHDIPSFGVNLKDLKILDLRACYNLEQLPKDLDFLRSLTYFDISECYFLDFMPRNLALLPELQVLKGFVVSDKWKSCSLGELAGLKKLEKLGIIVNTKDFKVEEWENELSRFEVLKKLKISWGATEAEEKNKSQARKIEDGGNNGAAKEATNKLQNNKKKVEGENQGGVSRQDKSIPKKAPDHNLEKLELEAFQDKDLPKWMGPKFFKNLKKLYIRGGNVKNIQKGEEKWDKVEILRLAYLNELKMDWKQIQELFPKLWYLEKVKCPKITLCPCDGNGVWTDHEKRDGMINNPEKRKAND